MLALLIQLATGFAHVHVAAAQAAPALFTVVNADDGVADRDHAPAGLACDVCAILSLGGTADTPPAPAVLSLPQHTSTAVWTITADAITARRHTCAQSRAPPAA